MRMLMAPNPISSRDNLYFYTPTGCRTDPFAPIRVSQLNLRTYLRWALFRGFLCIIHDLRGDVRCRATVFLETCEDKQLTDTCSELGAICVLLVAWFKKNPKNL